MKNLLLVAAFLFALFSCRSSENFTIDQISKSSGLERMKTFQVINQKNAERNIVQLNKIFEKRLVEKGFIPVTENPDLLIQSVISAVDFENNVKGFTSTNGAINTGSFDPAFSTTGEYGKAMFLIQDAKTNEVLWMGIGTGILSTNQQLNKKEIFAALNQMTADLRK